MSLLFHINSSSSYEPTLLSNAVYSVQNTSRVTVISSSDDPENNVLITLLTFFLWFLSEWSYASLRMWGITHIIHPVTAKSVLMCNFLFCHKLYTVELRLSNISESLVSGSLVSIFSSSSSVSLSDYFHTFLDEDPYIGNSSLLSRSVDDLFMDIFVIME